MLLSHAFNDAFQQTVAKAVAAADGGSGSVIQHKAPVKTALRMMAKLRHDHKMNEAPRSSANIDTIRCGVACRTPEDLRRAYAAVSEAFGGRVVRVKNGYSRDFDASAAFHYRGILINLEVRVAALSCVQSSVYVRARARACACGCGCA
jgi:hypothetical protein